MLLPTATESSLPDRRLCVGDDAGHLKKITYSTEALLHRTMLGLEAYP